MQGKEGLMLQDNENKIFVLDTNVPLYDYNCIYNFQEHNVVLPITLLEEIDKFKKGNETINFHAREFSRELDNLIGDGELNDGVKLSRGGELRIETDTRYDAAIKDIFWVDSPDHRILSIAYNLSKKFGHERVILVSKDINLRMKAKSVGILAEDYKTGQVKNLDELYTGKNIFDKADDSVIDTIYRDGALPFIKAGLDHKPVPNEFFILRNDHKSLLARYINDKKELRFVEKRRAYGIKPRNAEQIFSLEALSDTAVALVTLAGKAGTGKTLMALAAALEARKNYKTILLARPIIPLSNRDMGYLPGDISEKLDPYMKPLFDNLAVIQNQFEEGSADYEKINELLQSEKLLIMPLAYIRGRSLSKSYFIVDEAQNLTPHEVKAIITRAGEGTKIVFTGDPYQIDTPYLDARSNGLTFLIDKMKGQNLYAHVTLEKGERSELAELASNIL